jgi:hypothetical protein
MYGIGYQRIVVCSYMQLVGEDSEGGINERSTFLVMVFAHLSSSSKNAYAIVLPHILNIAMKHQCTTLS